MFELRNEERRGWYEEFMEEYRPYSHWSWREGIDKLPSETLSRIFEFLVEDIPSLKACSLTCSAWASANRHNMFRSITIDSGARYREFLQAEYGGTGRVHWNVRKLRLSLEKTSSEDDRGWFYHIIERCDDISDKLHTLEIRHLHGFRGDIDGYFLRCLASWNSIQTLILDSCSFNVHQLHNIVASFRNLRHLVFNQIAFCITDWAVDYLGNIFPHPIKPSDCPIPQNFGPQAFTQHRLVAPIESISVRSNMKVLQWSFCYWLNFTSLSTTLHTLDISLDEYDSVQPLSILLDRLSQDLKNLRLYSNTSRGWKLWNCISLSNLTGIVKLNLGDVFNPNIIPLLSQFPHPHQLLELEFSLSFKSIRYFKNCNHKDLDSLLCSSTKFQALQQVVFVYTGSEDFTLVSTKTKRVFTGLVGRGILSVRLDD
ncbi:hypothetical protein C8Q75DRAFT_570275 [Abortiporus biennis]|nr:hypothetical protein C8Q75DRAFT_570275 [Abortiporus biennis]